MRDLFSQVKLAPCFAPATATATPTAIVVDRKGFESVMFAMRTGAGGIEFTGTNKIEWRVRHSDVAGSGFTPVAEDDLQLESGETYQAGGIVRAITAAHAAASLRKCGYIGNKQYIEVLPVFGGTHSTGTHVDAVALLSHPSIAPV